jgi:hypothetical protein
MVGDGCFRETGFGIQGTRGRGQANRSKLNQFALNVLALMKNNTRSMSIELHTKQEGRIPHVLDLKFLLHLGSKEERIRANDD